MEKVDGEPLPWDRPKPDPADGDLFDMVGLPVDGERLTLAQLEAEPIFREDGQRPPSVVESVDR